MTKLDGIIRLKKWQLDEDRRALADLFDERGRAENAIAYMDQEMEEQCSMRGSDIASMTFGAYIEGARKKRAWLVEALRLKDEEIAAKQDIVAEAFRELKTFEIADAAQKSRQRDAENKIEQAELDEQGVRAFERANDDYPV